MGNKLLYDLTGKRFGKWSVLSVVQRKNPRDQVMYLCRCDCGTEKVVPYQPLIRGYTLACKQCFKSSKRNNPVYRKWREIKAACYNPCSAQYYRYGAFGVKLCDRWMNVDNFYADLGDPPKDKPCIVLKYGATVFDKDTTRWGTDKESQYSGASSRIHILYKGEWLTMREISQRENISRQRVQQKLLTTWKNVPIVRNGIQTTYPEVVGKKVTRKAVTSYSYPTKDELKKCIADAYIAMLTKLKGVTAGKIPRAELRLTVAAELRKLERTVMGLPFNPRYLESLEPPVKESVN